MMRFRMIAVLTVTALLAGCGSRDEFQHETVQAYQADNGLRQDVLNRCADHITKHQAFATQSDTEECRKALAADQNVRLASHWAKERASSNAALGAAAKQFEGK